MITGINPLESGFCWKKSCQVNISAKLQLSRNLFWDLKISDAGASQKEAPGEPGGPHATLGHDPRWGRAELWRGHLGPPPRLPFRVYLPPGKPRRGGGIIHEIFRRLHGMETIERERVLWQGDPAGEIPSWRGEIIAIVTVSTLDFIGIIIHHAIMMATGWLTPRGRL